MSEFEKLLATGWFTSGERWLLGVIQIVECKKRGGSRLQKAGDDEIRSNRRSGPAKIRGLMDRLG